VFVEQYNEKKNAQANTASTKFRAKMMQTDNWRFGADKFNALAQFIS